MRKNLGPAASIVLVAIILATGFKMNVDENQKISSTIIPSDILVTLETLNTGDIFVGEGKSDTVFATVLVVKNDLEEHTMDVRSNGTPWRPTYKEFYVKMETDANKGIVWDLTRSTARKKVSQKIHFEKFDGSL